MTAKHAMQYLLLSLEDMACPVCIGLDLSVLCEAAALVRSFLTHHQNLSGKVSGC